MKVQTLESSQKLFIRALKGETLARPPFWLMRQAGRYLPEYRATRAHAGSFLDLCFAPELAVEVTLQLAGVVNTPDLPAGSAPLDADAGQDLLELRAVVDVSGGDREGERPSLPGVEVQLSLLRRGAAP